MKLSLQLGTGLAAAVAVACGPAPVSAPGLADQPVPTGAPDNLPPPDRAGPDAEPPQDDPWTSAEADCAPVATRALTMVVNLDGAAWVGARFDSTDVDSTSNFHARWAVFDSIGRSHPIAVYFSRTSFGWNWNAVADGRELQGGAAGRPTIIGAGAMTFSADGALNTLTPSPPLITASFADGAAANQQIRIDFGDDIASGGTGQRGTTQWAGGSFVRRISDDGTSWRCGPNLRESHASACAPLATTAVRISGNVDARRPVEPAFDVVDATQWHHHTSFVVNDSLGVSRVVSVIFTRTALGWDWNAVVDGGDLAGGWTGTMTLIGSGSMTFTTGGELNTLTPNPPLMTASFDGGAAANQQIVIVLGDDVATGGTGRGGLTQMPADSVVTEVLHDGHGPRC